MLLGKWVGDGRDQRIRVLPRIEPRVLDDDGDVRLDQAGVLDPARHRRVVELVEPLVEGAAVSWLVISGSGPLLQVGM
jgi:hypothetical protein